MAALVASAGALGAGPRLIGEDGAIGGARLGETKAEYARAFGALQFMTRLPKRVTRLTFEGGEVHVFISSATGRGVGILISAKEYRTARGIGPCSPVASLLATYRNRLSPYRVRPGNRIAAYRMGSLMFVVTGDKVGSVVLASSRVPPSIALNAAQCGVGEEE
jgi:hypothetical protein